MFERAWTVILPGGQAPAAVTIQNMRLPDQGRFELEAWTGSPNVGNVLLLEGDVTLATAQEQLGTSGDRYDCLMAVPSGSVGRVRIPDNLAERITVFWDTANAQSQAVTIKIKEVKK